MANGKFISSLRVSTDKQGVSGLGLEAQQQAITRYLNGGDWKLVREYVEVESGKRKDRPQLEAATAHCKRVGATLIIAKLDRLHRNMLAVATLMDSGVEFVVADMPTANRLTLHIMAAVGENEGRTISERTAAALAVKRERLAAGLEVTKTCGLNRLGNPNGAAALRRAGKGNDAAVAAVKGEADRFAADLKPVIDELKAEGFNSLEKIAAELNERGIITARGGRWHAMTVKLIIDRAA